MKNTKNCSNSDDCENCGGKFWIPLNVCTQESQRFYPCADCCKKLHPSEWPKFPTPKDDDNARLLELLNEADDLLARIESEDHGSRADEITALRGKINSSSNRATQQLPTEAGFYWWRENKESAWRMVQAVDFGVEDKSQLMTYDVQNHAWSGRSLNAWKAFFPIGEWCHVTEPNKQNQP
jgi:hypothetical protein